MNDEEFYKQFDEMKQRLLPTKKTMFAFGVGAVLLNIALFAGGVAIIAIAVKWAIS